MCGCENPPTVELQTRAAMAMTLFAGGDLDRPIGDQPQFRFMPDEHGYIRWLRITWVGVPKPIRWIYASSFLRGFLGLPEITGELWGCGCIKTLRDIGASTAWRFHTPAI